MEHTQNFDKLIIYIGFIEERENGHLSNLYQLASYLLFSDHHGSYYVSYMCKLNSFKCTHNTHMRISSQLVHVSYYSSGCCMSYACVCSYLHIYIRKGSYSISARSQPLHNHFTVIWRIGRIVTVLNNHILKSF